MIAALQNWGLYLRGITLARAEQRTAAPDQENERMTLPQGSQELLRAIATLEREATSHEAHDTLLAQRLGRELGDTRHLMELLAQEGYLYLKRGLEPGYSSWLSARGRTLL